MTTVRFWSIMYTGFWAVVAVLLHHGPSVSAFILGTGLSECQHYWAYGHVLQLADPNRCDSISEVMKTLDELYKLEKYQSHSGRCLADVIERLKGVYGSTTGIPVQCSCTGSLSLTGYYNQVNGMYSHYQQCSSHQDYMDLYHHFVRNSHNKNPDCASHHSLWHRLTIHGTNYNSHCQSDLVEHIAYGYKMHSQSCRCFASGVHSVTGITPPPYVTMATVDACLQHNSSQKLLSIADNGLCVSSAQVWQYLEDLVNIDDSCRQRIVNILSDRYHNQANLIASGCTCEGTPTSRNMVTIHDGDHTTCNGYSNNYRYLESHNFNNAANYGCGTHHYLWNTLHNVHVNNHDCQKDFIRHAALTITHPENDPCQCKSHGVHSVTGITPPPSVTMATVDACLQHNSSQKILSIADNGLCVSSAQVWQYLEDLINIDDSCRQRIVNILSGRYHNQNNLVASGCTCEGTPTSRKMVSINDGSGDHPSCNRYSGNYRYLEEHNFNNAAHYGCGTHHYLWNKLHNVHVNNHECQKDFIRHAALTITHPENDPCHCRSLTTSLKPSVATGAATTHEPMTTASVVVTTATETVPTSPLTTLPVPSAALSTCDKVLLIQAVAFNLSVTHPNSSLCDPSLDDGSNEDLVLHFCNASENMVWHQGDQVMKHCADIPLYSPVSTFHSGMYSYTHDMQSGIFIGCVDNGFRMAVQRCNGVTTIIHVEAGTGQAFSDNPDNYFALLSAPPTRLFG